MSYKVIFTKKGRKKESKSKNRKFLKRTNGFCLVLKGGRYLENEWNSIYQVYSDSLIVYKWQNISDLFKCL